MSDWTQTQHSLSSVKTRVDDYLSGLDTFDLIGILNDEA